jgi:hypothetical protein
VTGIVNAPPGSQPRSAQSGAMCPRSSGMTSSGCGYRPSIDFVNTGSPFTCTSKLPSAPGISSRRPTTSSHSSRMRSTRPVALGRAPQGTQYSIRTWARPAIDWIQACGVRFSGGRRSGRRPRGLASLRAEPPRKRSGISWQAFTRGVGLPSPWENPHPGITRLSSPKETACGRGGPLHRQRLGGC